MAVFPLDRNVPLGALDPAEALAILEERAHEAQSELARHTDLEPHVLNYLALNGAPATRAAVAANMGAPAAVNRLLANDGEENVRAELAAKIARLMPGLSTRESDHVCRLTIETLECLARDCAVRVRAILAEEIKSLDCVPTHVVQLLARDLESIVAAPILEYSPLLSDADLMEIVAYAQVNEVLAAVAKRRPLSAGVSDAVAASLDIPAVAALLCNPDAAIRAETLERIVEQAERIGAWHVPLALRSDLSARALRRVSAFVGASQIEQLAGRHGMSESLSARLNRQLRSRLDAGEGAPCDGASQWDAAAVALARQSGRLDDSFVETAVQAGQRETVILALAELAGVPAATVRRIVATRTPKPVVALVWRAGLGSRVAFTIQRLLMKLPALDLLPARDGVGFPLSDEEMRWHLNYFDIAV